LEWITRNEGREEPTSRESGNSRERDDENKRQSPHNHTNKPIPFASMPNSLSGPNPPAMAPFFLDCLLKHQTDKPTSHDIVASMKRITRAIQVVQVNAGRRLF
jgi:hypothetical protein